MKVAYIKAEDSIEGLTTRAGLGKAHRIAAFAVMAVSLAACGDYDGGGNTTTGGLSGDTSKFPMEMACMQNYAQDPSNNFVNYWPAIGAPEHTDAIHSGVNPCATFTGSFSGPNQVLQATSTRNYGAIGLVVFDGPSGAYLQAPGTGVGVPPAVASFNPSTGEQIWQTSLASSNPNQWVALGSMAIHANGYLYNVTGPTIYKLNRPNGHIVASAPMIVLGMPSTDANYDGFHIAPDQDGTILLKTQTRPVGCPTQGNAAMLSCQAMYGPQPNTTVVAVDPDTLETLDAILLNQSVTARPIVTKHNGTIYMYLAANTTLVRVIWDPTQKKLTQDMSWAPSYLLPGQGVGCAPANIGDWIITNQNCQPGSVPISVVAVNQDDPTKLTRINPWGTTLPPGVPASNSPGSFGTDPANSMIFAQDWFVNGVFGIKLDQATGAMHVVWSRPDWRTSDYFSLVGPPDKRTLISQYINPNFTFSQLSGNAYTESVLWANAATGDTIAQSAYNASTAQGSLANLGYGGRIYTMGNAGEIFIYQPEPASGMGIANTP